MKPQITLQSMAPTDRKHRRPKHKFNIEQRPYALTPFMIAPVLPGETFSGAYFETRQVTDPVRNPLIGWSSEFYWFYVKIRDLADAATLETLFVDPTQNLSALNSAADQAFYHRGGSPNFLQMCVRRITEVYFRDDGEAWNNVMIGSYPAVQFRDQGWLDSLTDTTILPDGGAVVTSSYEAMDRALEAYEYLLAHSLTDMSFDDYLRTFGVTIPKSEERKPELIAQVREFQYPSNTVEPSTGVPSSAVSWVLKAPVKKRMFFREPGFIVGVSVVRPKIYFGRQFGSLAHHLDQGLSWLPAIMKDSPETSLREFTGGAAGTGPLSNGTVGPANGYIVDMRDLFLYGDQFTNLAPDAARYFLDLPTAALQRKYPTQAMTETIHVGLAAGRTRADGFTSLDILGMQQDYTRTVNTAILG